MALSPVFANASFLRFLPFWDPTHRTTKFVRGAQEGPTEEPSGGAIQGQAPPQGGARPNTQADAQAELDALFGAPGAGAGPNQLTHDDLIGGFHASQLDNPETWAPYQPYFEGDEVSTLAVLTTEDRLRLQDRMASLGLLTGNWVPGQVDPKTVSTFKTLMGMANATGNTWEQVLGQLEQDPELQRRLKEGAGGAGFVRPTYLAPDYATLSEEVKSVFSNKLGRDPDEAEMAQLVGELQGWDRQRFDVEVGAQQRRAEGQSGGTGQQVDPVARFTQAFENRYSEELDIVDDRKDHAVSRQNLQASVQQLRQMSRGGL